jgi:hypothetical protein
MDTKLIQGLLLAACAALVLGIVLTVVDLPRYKHEGGAMVQTAARTARPTMAVPAETPAAAAAAPAGAE